MATAETARIVLLVTSPRLPAGLLTAQAWDALRTYPVLTAREDAQTTALRAAGVAVTLVEHPTAADLLAAVSAPARDDLPPGEEDEPRAGPRSDAAPERGRGVVWLAGPAGDPDLARELGLRLAREPALAELELMYGSWDPPGARLLDTVTVIDRLASPGGDPWKRSQTHASLAQFLLEEAYEAYDAIAAGDTGALREELGDVLLQVVLHARLAEEAPDEAARWSVDDVAGDLVDKLVRRNPHVFAGATVDSVEEIVENWEQIKRVEKSRESTMDGIALTQPALSLAAKVLSRAQRSGIEPPLPGSPLPEPPSIMDSEQALGAGLLATVAAARQRGLDAEAALRAATLAYAESVRTAERHHLSGDQ